jgi:4-hydroxy-tetrahydrodipicolinate synthase
VPFGARGRLNAGAQERCAAYLAAQPIAGAAVWAHTGRGLHLDRETALAVIRSWREALPGKLLVAGAGAPPARFRRGPRGDRAYLDHARAMAELAATSGADLALVFPPLRFRERAPRDRRRLIAAYHAAVARAGLPAIAFYLYAAAGGVSYTAGELADILATPGVVAIKVATLDSVMTFQDLACQIERHFPGTVILTGEDRFLGYSLLRGADGALIGLGAACPAFQERLIAAARAARAGEPRAAAEFVARSRQADRFAECTFVAPMEGYIRRLLHALSVLGVIPTAAAHDPWFPPLGREERAAIARTVREISKEG